MAKMGHERSKPKPLHNFTLPCGLKWGNQKFLRCAKVDSDRESVEGRRRSSGSELIGRRKINDRRSNGVKEMEVGFRSVVYGGGAGGGGIAAVREKLMFDLQAEADKMKYAIFRDGLEEEEEEEEKVFPTPAPVPANTAAANNMTEVAAAADGSRPWNLRTRRAACKAPMNGVSVGGGGGGGGSGSNGNLKVDGSSAIRLRSEFSGVGAGGSCTGGKRKRESFSISLSRREIEEDFMEMVGHRPSRRPKKRAKLVQKNMDTLFPGLWLTEITPDLYKVPDDQ